MAARLGAGLVVSEMTASRRLWSRAAAMLLCGPRARASASTWCSLPAARRAGWRKAPASPRPRRGDHRHQHGLSGPPCDRRAVGLGADARSRSCADPDRGDGRGGVGAGDAQDAARLGRPHDQCAGACPPRRSGRRAHDHRARAHALPVLQGPRRLGGGARGQGQRRDPGRGQRRHRFVRRRRLRRSRPPAPTR